MQQAKTHPESFIRGAFLITIAQLVTKVMGAVHRPVAQLLIGDRGLALATPPSNAYYFFLGLSSVGLNVAISRLIAERLAVEDYRGAHKVIKVAAGMLVASGLFFSLLFAATSGWVSRAIGFPEAMPGFLVLAPALFFVAILCVFRGLYQGMQRMQPSALSQVVEQTARVLFSIILMAVMVRVSLVYGAAAFNVGNTIGIALAVLYFVWLFLRQRPTADWTYVAPGVESYEHESILRLMGKILSIAVPLSLVGAVLPLMSMVDAALVTNQLLRLGIPEGPAKDALAYLGNAGTLRDLPTILTNALYVSLVPAIAESYATERLDQARNRAAAAFRITFLVGLPATAGLLAGARDVYGILYTGPGYVVMGALSWSTMAMMIWQTAAGILLGTGRVWLSVRNLAAGLVAKVILTYWWTGIPALQANGAAYATGVGFFLTAGLNLWSLWRLLGFKVDVRGSVIRPAVASAVMGVIIWVISPMIHQWLPLVRLAGLLVVGIGALVYLVAIFALGGITASDLGMIPGIRPWMLDWLRQHRLLRD